MPDREPDYDADDESTEVESREPDYDADDESTEVEPRDPLAQLDEPPGSSYDEPDELYVDGPSGTPVRGEPADDAGGAAGAPGGMPGWAIPTLVLVGIVVLILVIVALTGGSDSEPQVATGAGGDQIGTTAPPAEPSGADDEPADTATAAEAELPPQLRPVQEILGRIDGTIGVQQILTLIAVDQLLDFLYSISTVAPGNPGPDVDLAGFGRLATQIESGMVTRLFGNTEFPCVGDGVIDVVCGDLEFPEVEGFQSVVLVLDDDVATDGSLQYVYSVVFDADGDAANNWTAKGDFDWDQFLGTDTWYQLMIDGATGFGTVSRTVVNADQTTSSESTAVRVALLDNVIVFMVPDDEVPVDAAYRVTTFRHDGTYAPERSAGDVSGDDPTQPPTSD